MKTKTKKPTPLPKLLKKAQTVFNGFIRERDKNDPCIACGKHHDQYDAGHYVPVKNGSALRFHEWNNNKEGKSCNGFDSFHLIGYRKRLIEKIGEENVEWLEANRHEVKKWTREDLMEIIKKYK
jgi:hypothetical protein